MKASAGDLCRRCGKCCRQMYITVHKGEKSWNLGNLPPDVTPSKAFDHLWRLIGRVSGARKGLAAWRCKKLILLNGKWTCSVYASRPQICREFTCYRCH